MTARPAGRHRARRSPAAVVTWLGIADFALAALAVGAIGVAYAPNGTAAVVDAVEAPRPSPDGRRTVSVPAVVAPASPTPSAPAGAPETAQGGPRRSETHSDPVSEVLVAILTGSETTDPPQETTAEAAPTTPAATTTTTQPSSPASSTAAATSSAPTTTEETTVPTTTATTSSEPVGVPDLLIGDVPEEVPEP